MRLWLFHLAKGDFYWLVVLKSFLRRIINIVLPNNIFLQDNFIRLSKKLNQFLLKGEVKIVKFHSDFESQDKYWTFLENPAQVLKYYKQKLNQMLSTLKLKLQQRHLIADELILISKKHIVYRLSKASKAETVTVIDSQLKAIQHNTFICKYLLLVAIQRWENATNNTRWKFFSSAFYTNMSVGCWLACKSLFIFSYYFPFFSSSRLLRIPIYLCFKCN